VNLLSTSNGANNPVLVNIPANAKVEVAGWTPSNKDPLKTIAPAANAALDFR